MPLLADPDRMRGSGHAALDVAQRAWRGIVDLLAECLKVS